MRLLIVISILCFSFTHGSQNPYGNNPPQYYSNPSQDNYNPQGQQQQQQQGQQQSYQQQGQQQGQQGQQQYHPQQGHQPPPQQPQQGIPTQPMGRDPSYNQYGQSPRPGPPPPGYGQMAPYGRGPPPQPEGNPGGLFSKLKNSIIAAGSALTGGPELPPGPPQYGPRLPQGPPQYGQNPPPGSFGKPASDMRGQPYGARPSISHGPPPEEGAPAGLFSKLKNMFSGDDSKPDTSFVPRRGPPTGGPPGYGSQFQKPPGSGQIPGGPPGSDPYARRGSPVGGQPQQPIPPGYPGYDRPPPGYGDGPGSQLPPGLDSDPFRPQQQQGMPLGYSSPDQYQSLPPQQQQQQGGGYDASRSGYGQQPGFFPPAGPEAGLYGQEPMIVAEPEPIIPPEPQLFTVDESVILILKPKEFHRKKTAILRAGSGSVQVFSDFEHVFTKFKQDNGEPTYSTAEVVESSPALLPGAITQIQAINQEVQNLSLDLEEAMARCQSIIAREGGLNTMSIPIITKESLPRMGLRDGWKEALSALASRNVPTYIFSDGYGDVIVHALLQGGVGEYGALPQNLRIVSNFFRAGPDGTVRAFSQPIVHELNKNITTAGLYMGFPVTERPYNIVIGSSEDGGRVAEGLDGVKDTLSIGYLELTEDLLQRLPTFLSSYDAVVLGDGSFQYIKSLLEELLQVPSTPAHKKTEKKGPSIFDRGLDIFG